MFLLDIIQENIQASLFNAMKLSYQRLAGRISVVILAVACGMCVGTGGLESAGWRLHPRGGRYVPTSGPIESPYVAARVEL